MKKYLFGVIALLGSGLLFYASLQPNDKPEAQVQAVPTSISSPSQIIRPLKADLDFGKMPLFFVPNRGQLDSRVAYYVQGQDKIVYFTAEGITFVLIKPVEMKEKTETVGHRGSIRKMRAGGLKEGKSGKGLWTVRLEFLGARKINPVGKEETGAAVSYFKGKPAEWKTSLPTYSKLVYNDLWPGIDLVYAGAASRLKYELIVHPGADPSKIQLAYKGAESVEIGDNGWLNVTTPLGSFQDDLPVAYQKVDGKKASIPLSYRLDSGGGDSANTHLGKRARESHAFVFGFQVGEYDRTKPLVLDPAVLVYCGYIGGWGDESAESIAVDGGGNVYVTGFTNSPETSFPVKVGPGLINMSTDAFVAKVKSDGSGLVYCGYIGGEGDDFGHGIAVDNNGNAYLTGHTFSSELSFPVKVGPDLSYNDWSSESYGDAFVAKVNSSGSNLAYCGYIGGISVDKGAGIAVDSNGNAYVTGETSSREKTGKFPVKVGPDLTYNGGEVDAFVAKVNSAGTGLVFCGYIGGNNNDRGTGIAVDNGSNAYITGYTDSAAASFPVARGPDLTHNGDDDAFVAKVNSSGEALAYCGYVGGSMSDEGRGIAVDGYGSAYLTGRTASPQTSFPVVVGPDLTQNSEGLYDAFVAKVNPSGSGLTYCGYIGGSADDFGQGIAVDIAGNAYLAGYTWSTETSFPVTGGPSVSFSGTDDAFVAKVNPSGTSLAYCGYIGGFSSDAAACIAVDSSGDAYVAGETDSPEMTFPVTEGPDLSFNGWPYDAFVAKVHHLNKMMISGKITAGGSPLQDVMLSGLPGNPQTDSAGAYAVQVDSGWSGTVIPTKAGFAFSPPSRTYSNVTSNQTNQDYTASTIKISISGHVKAGETGLQGVTVAFSNSGGTTATDVNGYYSQLVNYGWSGTATPSKTGYTFSPPNRNYSNVISNQSSQDFAATLITLSISGYVKTDGSAGVQGVTISFSNSGGSATTDSSGYYANFVNYAWSGTATPSKTEYTFSPASRSYSNVISNQTGQDYTAAVIYPQSDFLGSWDSQGVYYQNSETAGWVKLASPADFIAAGDLDNDGKDDLIGVWPGQGGVWVRYSKTGDWSKLASAARHISSGDMNGDGRDDFLGSWDGLGVYYKDSVTGLWHKLATPADLVAAGDLDGDNTDDLIGVWPAQGGVWVKYSKTGDWARLAMIAVDIASGDMNGDGRADLLGTWSGQGVFYLDSVNGAWVKMATPAEQVTAGDLDGDGIKDLIGQWTSQGGIWVKYSKTATWSRLASPARDIGSGLMRGGAWSMGGPFAPVEELKAPRGGLAQGPLKRSEDMDQAAGGPGGFTFVWIDSPNLAPQLRMNIARKFGPGERGFHCLQQANLIPREDQERKRGIRDKTQRVDFKK